MHKRQTESSPLWSVDAFLYPTVMEQAVRPVVALPQLQWRLRLVRRTPAGAPGADDGSVASKMEAPLQVVPFGRVQLVSVQRCDPVFHLPKPNFALIGLGLNQRDRKSVV